MPFLSKEKPNLLIATLVVIACLVSVAAPLWIELIVFLGQYIYPVDNVLTDYLVGLVWAGVLGISILIWPIPDNHKRILFLLWLVRVVVALGFMLLFEYYYEGRMDALMYVNESRALSQFEWGEAGTHRIIGLVWLFHTLLPDTYHAAKVTFSMFGLLSVYLFYRTVVLFIEREEPRMLYVLGLFPSIVFWSSLLGKDPVVLFGIALYVYGVVGQYKRQHIFYLACIVLGIVIAMSIRPWMGVVLTLPLATFLISHVRSIGFRFVLISAFVVLSFVSFTSFTLLFNIETPEDVVSQFSVFQENASAGGSISNDDVALEDLEQILFFLPIGVFTALFRPLPGEVLNLFGVLASIENVGVLILLWLAITRSRFSDLWNPIILWGIALVLIWGVFYSSIAFNLGMIVRYKLQIWPVLVCILIYLARKRTTPQEDAPASLEKAISPARS